MAEQIAIAKSCSALPIQHLMEHYHLCQQHHPICYKKYTCFAILSPHPHKLAIVSIGNVIVT
jgi:hypothetical protein